VTDYRLPLNRLAYFDALYASTLKHGVSPGLVYLYLPELAVRKGWDEEQRLWFAFLNGLTQNPITSLALLEQIPECPPGGVGLRGFEDWFNDNWSRLQFDTDRRYAKKDTAAAIRAYGRLAEDFGGQVPLLTGSFKELWERASGVPTLGRLSTFSYLEYVKISGYGADCDSLMFGDREGSRSHRNGMLMLRGLDSLVWDKRAQNGFDGEYEDFRGLCARLDGWAARLLEHFRAAHPNLIDAGNFTLESALCAFKNSFFGRRYLGCYADMAWERILWAEEHGWTAEARVFRDIRADRLPDWLRCEVTRDGLTIKQRAAVFPETGSPYRAEHFLGIG
jgi:hypothetical protein